MTIAARSLSKDGLGACLDLSGLDPQAALSAAATADLRAMMTAAHGLLMVRGLTAITDDPRALVTLSKRFGPEVENIRETLTAARFFHPDVPEVMVLSNKPGVAHLPPPRLPLGPDGRLHVQFPHQANWHTDQSYRRPPPDVTLLYGHTCPPPDQGQTLFADCTAALDGLPQAERARLVTMQAIHSMRWVGRTADDVREGRAPQPLLPHQAPVRQPLLRIHPETGAGALYLCEERQLDYVDGPVVGLSTGPDGEGAALIRQLMTHATDPRFVYVHEWQASDLVIADNRSLLHAATWYDAATHAREMWRCTVMGNPGEQYAGEGKSWIPAAGHGVMEGLEDA